MSFPDQGTSYPEAAWPQRGRLLLLETGFSLTWAGFRHQHLEKVEEVPDVGFSCNKTMWIPVCGGWWWRCLTSFSECFPGFRFAERPPLWFLHVARVTLLQVPATAIAKLSHRPWPGQSQGQAQSLLLSSSKVWALCKVQPLPNVGTREGSKVSMGQEKPTCLGHLVC